MGDDDETEAANDRRQEEGEVGYTFEGYRLEFNTRVALTPAVPPQNLRR